MGYATNLIGNLADRGAKARRVKPMFTGGE
jgi:hypothetical protein